MSNLLSVFLFNFQIFFSVSTLSLIFRRFTLFISYLKCNLFPSSEVHIMFLFSWVAAADALFPSNPALRVCAGKSEALPLTVELMRFPAWPLCGPPGPSVVARAVGPHLSPVDK